MVDELQLQQLPDAVRERIEAGDPAGAQELLLAGHPADQADALERLDSENRALLLGALDAAQLAAVLEFLNPDLRAEIARALPADELAQLLERIEEDVAVDIVQDLPKEQAQDVVAQLGEPEVFRQLLAYPEESAGGIMSREVVALQREWTAEQAIEFLRRQGPSAGETFYLYVVDEAGRLSGVVSLRALVTAAPETPIAAITDEDVFSVQATEDQEVAAERMRHYNLLALPVIDETRRLLGVIRSYDVLDVQVAEATEDMFRLAGLTDEERLFRPLKQAVPPRLFWLSINLATAFLGAATVSLFQGTIEQVAALAVFMPIVAGMAGNAGIQTITLVVRSVAIGEIDVRDGLRVLKHEAIIALIKGIVIGATTALIALLWMGNPWLGLIVGLALLINIVNATLVGVIVPLTLRRLKADPALASGVLVTTVSDVTGFFVFLGMAALLVSRLD